MFLLIQNYWRKANASLPEIEQILIGNEIFKNELEFDDKLYLIRKRIEKKINRKY